MKIILCNDASTDTMIGLLIEQTPAPHNVNISRFEPKMNHQNYNHYQALTSMGIMGRTR